MALDHGDDRKLGCRVQAMIEAILTRLPGLAIVGFGYMVAAAMDIWLGTCCLQEIRATERTLNQGE